MNDKDLENVREKLLAGEDEEKEAEPQKVTFEDLFKGDGEKREVRPKVTDPIVETAVEEAPLSEEDRLTLNLKQIRRLISAYRWRLADAERRVNDLRMKLAGLETEYKVLVGEPAVPEAPTPKSPEPAPPARKPRAPRSTSSTPASKRKEISWKETTGITLEEAAWRVLIEQGKSLPLWRIASAMRRKGFPEEFTESGLSTMVRGSTRLGFTGEGHIYIK